jgi:uncharacterized protein YkwD
MLAIALRGADKPYVTSAVLGIALALGSLARPVSTPVLSTPAAQAPASVAMGYGSTAIAPSNADVRVMLAALNAERTSRGLEPLGLDPNLCKLAANYASDMATRHFFSHRSPDGSTPFVRMDRAHIHYGYAGENIALDSDPQSAAQALWNSNPHRENILEPHYAKVGIGAIQSADGEIFVEDFSD